MNEQDTQKNQNNGERTAESRGDVEVAELRDLSGRIRTRLVAGSGEAAPLEA